MGYESNFVRIGILEDDPFVLDVVTRFLVRNRFVVEPFRSGNEVLDAVGAEAIDLLLLDLSLPGEDGIDILTRLRLTSRLPVLIISGRSESDAITRGLDAGADDYVTKPIAFEVLGARVRSVLRRFDTRTQEQQSNREPLRFGPVAIDIGQQQISSASHTTSLTEREAQLLSLMLHADGKPVSREALTRATVGQAWEISLRSLDVHISNIRKKLTNAGVAGNPIRTVRNLGYRLVNPEADSQLPSDD